MIGIRSAFSIRARGHRPHLEAVYMTAPRSVCRNTKKALPTGGRPYMTATNATSPRLRGEVGEGAQRSLRVRGDYPRVRACFSPSPARRMLATFRTRGEVKSGDAERAHPHIAPTTPASASLWPTLPTKGGAIRKSGLSPQAGRGEERSAVVMAIEKAWRGERAG